MPIKTPVLGLRTLQSYVPPSFYRSENARIVGHIRFGRRQSNEIAELLHPFSCPYRAEYCAHLRQNIIILLLNKSFPEFLPASAFLPGFVLFVPFVLFVLFYMYHHFHMISANFDSSSPICISCILLLLFPLPVIR